MSRINWLYLIKIQLKKEDNGVAKKIDMLPVIKAIAATKLF
jgi:hypothetical protein